MIQNHGEVLIPIFQLFILVHEKPNVNIPHKTIGRIMTKFKLIRDVWRIVGKLFLFVAVPVSLTNAEVELFLSRRTLFSTSYTLSRTGPQALRAQPASQASKSLQVPTFISTRIGKLKFLRNIIFKEFMTRVKERKSVTPISRCSRKHTRMTNCKRCWI